MYCIPTKRNQLLLNLGMAYFPAKGKTVPSIQLMMISKVKRNCRKRLSIDKTLIHLSNGLVAMEGMISTNEIRSLSSASPMYVDTSITSIIVLSF